jgi:ribonuclease P protein component
VPTEVPGSRTPRKSSLDVRVWRGAPGGIPLLLVSASRKNGGAVERNRFRRRIRMAFLDILRETGGEPLDEAIVWIRPSRGLKLDKETPFTDLKGQLRLAFRHWTSR